MIQVYYEKSPQSVTFHMLKVRDIPMDKNWFEKLFIGKFQSVVDDKKFKWGRKSTTQLIEIDFDLLEDGVNINHFYIPQELRGEGRGTELLQTLELVFQTKGCDYMVVNMKNRGHAKEFLESNGFEIVENTDHRLTGEKEL